MEPGTPRARGSAATSRSRTDSGPRNGEKELPDRGTLLAPAALPIARAAGEGGSYDTSRREYLKLAGGATASVLGTAAQSDRARAASYGYGEAGYGDGPYGGGSSVSTSTKDASGIGTTSASLNGSLNDLGGASSADVYFEYRVTGASSWTTTPVQTLTSTGSFTASVDGLQDGVDYEYRAAATASDGDTATGSTVTFTTTDDPPAVTTDSASSVGETVATLNGSLDDLGNASSADVSFQYRRTGASSWTTTSTQSLSSTGTFSRSVSGLGDGIEYEYRTRVDAVDGDTNTGSRVTFTTSAASPAVTTDAVSDVGETTATLNGSLNDLGNASSADIYFEYRRTGASSWNVTARRTLSSPGAFSASVSGLDDGVDYEYRAVVVTSDDGYGALTTTSDGSDTGSLVTFTTTDDPPTVTTGSASGIGETVATLNGSLNDLGNASSADVSFQYRPTGASSWNETSVQTLSSTGPFSVDVTDLSSGTDYEYRATATSSDDDGDTGSTVSFDTSASDASTSTDAPPSVDSYSVTEAGSPNPHCEITADWSVSDADEDLNKVRVTVVNSSGRLVDSATTSAHGATASGRNEFKIKHVSGQTFDVTVTVTDTRGESSSETRSVTE